MNQSDQLPIPDDGALSKAAGRAAEPALGLTIHPPFLPGRKEVGLLSLTTIERLGEKIKAASVEPTLTSFRIGDFLVQALI